MAGAPKEAIMKILQAGACALALCVGAMANAPARAQPFGFFEGGPFGPRVFAPDVDDWGAQGERRRVRRALEAHGYELLGPLARRGRTYEARVEDMRGERLRVIVDARSGEVIERFGLRSALEGPPRPPRNVGPDRLERVEPFERFGPRLRGPDFDGPPPVSALPEPQERRLAPAARKPAPRQARKPDPAREARKPDARQQARPAPAPAQQQQQAARPAPEASPAPQTQAPVPAPAAQAPAAETAHERNANLRRPDVAQRTSPPAADAPAPARPAPRVVYPGPATSPQPTE
jgi:hypothetical protein